MPFTLSHPAAVLLFRGTGLPMAALVAGSMAPDLPMFIPGRRAYGVTHSLVGVVSVDVVIAFLIVVVWVTVVRDALVDLSPAVVRERLASTVRWSPRYWALVPPAAALGALSHVVWDAFTHPHRWGVEHVAWLREVHAGLPGAAWAQYVSGALGLVVVGAWAYRSLHLLPRLPRAPRVPELGVRSLAVVALTVAVVATLAGLTRVEDGLHALAFRGAVVGVIALVVGLLALAGTWQLFARRPVTRRAFLR